MSLYVGAYTDIGISRATNQDSLCIMQAESNYGDVCMAIVCDGMGGLEKGEMASASVIKSFERWFEDDLPEILKYQYSEEEILDLWKKRILYLDDRMKKYGMKNKMLLGTTFSGILILKNKYLWMHVGDSRIYQINRNAIQLTSDHTVAAREVCNGTMTEEEVKTSKLKSKLTQCVGASQFLEPETRVGILEEENCFLLCSDGFYHKFSQENMKELSNSKYENDKRLEQFCQNAVKNVMKMGEKDNISVIVLKHSRG